MRSSKIAPTAVVLITLTLFFQQSTFCFPNGNAAGTTAAAPSAEKYIRTELYFGLARAGGPDVTENEFQAFVDEFVTPRFPGGLTIIEARGQWRERDMTITKEGARILVLVYRRNERRAADTKIQEIRDEYKKRFSQQSVLRLDARKGINVDF